MKTIRSAIYASVAMAGLAMSTQASALKILLTNTGGVEQGTAAYTGFAAAAYFWESVLTDNVTVNFRVGFTSVGFAPTTLGQASSSSSNVAAAVWRSAITADATTALDASVIANLPGFTSSTVNLNTTVQKALGIYTGSATANDATITFNSARPFDFDTRDGFSGTPASDFISVAIHEMGHALGFTSNVGQNTTLNSRPSNTDLFRYKSTETNSEGGNINGSWDITWGGDPYFSIDGGRTEFKNNSGFSAGPDGFQTSHWREGGRIHDGVNCTILTEPQVGILDPTGGICQEGIVTAQDLAIMDAMGWNLNMNILADLNYKMSTSQVLQNYLNASVPEPSTWAMMIAGFGLVGGSLRRRRHAVRVTFG